MTIQTNTNYRTLFLFKDDSIKSVSIHEAKTQLSALISAMERTKEKVIIMKHNTAIAEISPPT